MLKTPLKVTAFAILGLWTLCVPARAAVITDSATYSAGIDLSGAPSAASSGSFHALDLFDPALGTLTSVALSVSQSTSAATLTMSLSCPPYVSNPVCNSSTSSSISQFFSLNLGSVAISLATPAAETIASCTTGWGNCTDSETGAATSLNESYVFTEAADLTSFTGTGQFAPSSGVLHILDIVAVDGGLGVSTSAGTAGATWGFAWDIAYTFTPVGVEPEPEEPAVTELPAPGSLALFAFGAVGIGAIRRQRRLSA